MPAAADTFYDDFPRLHFHDLDSQPHYLTCSTAIQAHDCGNFVVDFGGAPEDGGRAFCALNVGSDGESLDQVKALLGKRRDMTRRTRWINVFDPYAQSELVDAITAYYGFSPRLCRVITTPPAEQPRPPLASRHSVRRRDRFLGRGREEAGDDPEAQAMWGRMPMGVEEGVEMVRVENEGGARMNYMNLVQNVWYFHAVEWGGRFICIGFNHHHQKTSERSWNNKPPPPSRPTSGDSSDSDSDQPFDTGEYNPDGKRVWSWLTLCDDGTVISIHEPLGPLTTAADTTTIRRNILTVFRSLSITPLAHQDSRHVPSGLEDLPFRRHTPRAENVHDGPSLLLYYLFDDWHLLYDFVLGRGAPYSTQMRDLRNRMHSDPRLSHLSQLHRLSRQLAMLKRMYETRKIIVDNILTRQENALPRRHPAPAPDPNTPFAAPLGDPNVLGVPLGPLSIAKFERLRDRIKLYVLGELDSLLSERAELETLTFNLISLKQSATVELLTRVTIWLAGFTFVFLPLSLVTGYFSMQLRDTANAYSLRTFWGTGGVTIALTLVALYTIGKSTGTMKLGSVWRGVKRVWFGWIEKVRRRKRGREAKKGGRKTLVG